MIHDLAIIMLTGGATSLICKWLGQPVVLGYIVAGLLVGPHVAGSAWVESEESVEMWGQVGVIFLLFTLGLEFSFKKLAAMGQTAIVACLTIVVGMMSSGFMVGRLLGWDEMNSLFLGGMLCMSSTTIVFKALDDLGLRQERFAGIAFGILVVEDLFAVVLMVLLASIAVRQTLDGREMLASVTKFAAYLLFWFVAGILLVPSLLRAVRKHLTDETLTIISLALCLGMVLLATSAGFSEALGAFVMGSILAETVEVERIEHLMGPIKNMFGAVFFVSVGMMIAPTMLVAYWWPITLITLVVIVGQIVFASLGVVLSGQPLHVAMQTGFTLVQVGEFAFIIASFGESIGVTQPFLYPVVVAVSVITTFLTPYIIRLATPAYAWTDRHLPSALRLWLAQYARSRSVPAGQSLWSRYLQRLLLQVSIYLVASIFVLAIYFKYVNGLVVGTIDELLPDGIDWGGRLVSLLLVLTGLAPLVYKMVTAEVRTPEFHALWAEGALRRVSLVLIGLLRLLAALGLVGFAISQLFSFTSGVMFAVVGTVVAFIFFSRVVRRQAAGLEASFMANLSARETAADARRAVGQQLEAEFASHDLRLAEFDLPGQSDLCGRRLKSLDLRRRTGVSVVRILRAGQRINIPSAEERLMPADRVVVAGLDAHIQKFKELVDQSVRPSDASQSEHGQAQEVVIRQFAVERSMPFCGATLMQSHIADGGRCIVLSIEHGDDVSVGPDAQTVLHEGDLLTIAGEQGRVDDYLRSLSPVS